MAFLQPSVAGSFDLFRSTYYSICLVQKKSLLSFHWLWKRSPHSEAWHSRLSYSLSSLILGTGHTRFLVLFLNVPYIFILLHMKKEIATHSSILAWRILWTEEPGGLLSIGLRRVGYD